MIPTIKLDYVLLNISTHCTVKVKVSIRQTFSNTFAKRT